MQRERVLGSSTEQRIQEMRALVPYWRWESEDRVHRTLSLTNHPSAVSGSGSGLGSGLPAVSNEYLTFWRHWVVFAERHLVVVFLSVVDIPDLPDSQLPSVLSQPVTRVLPPLTLWRCGSDNIGTAAGSSAGSIASAGTGSGAEGFAVPDSAAGSGVTAVRVSLFTPLKPFSNKYKTKFRNLVPQVRELTCRSHSHPYLLQYLTSALSLPTPPSFP